MTPYIIELHDANVRVFYEDELVLESPGYALVNPTDVEVGIEAFNQARLHPRQVNNRFWQRLSTDPLAQHCSAARHHADLAYTHLQHLAKTFQKPAEVIFAVPSSYTSKQLSLITGIAQACSFTVVGLVDAAVAIAAGSELSSDQCLLLDIQLHQTDISVLTISDDGHKSTVRRSRINSVNVGLVKLYDRWIQLIADAFIEQCRFNPLHNAATEQALMLQLSDWLKAISNSEEVVLDIGSSGSHFQARLQTAEAIKQVRPIYDEFVAALKDASDDIKLNNILVREEVANLPGLRAVLPEVHVTNVRSVAKGCYQYLDFICGSQDDEQENNALRFVTALPLSSSGVDKQRVVVLDDESKETVSVSSQGVEEARGATHVLFGHQAYSFSKPLYIGEYNNSLEDDTKFKLEYAAHQLDALFCSIVQENAEVQLRVLNGVLVYLNGKPISGSQLLRQGDEITFESPGITLQVIGEVSYGTQA